MDRLIVIVLALFFGMSYAAIEEIKRRYQVKKLLKSRPQLSEREFAKRFFPEKQIVALAVRRNLAELLSTDISGLTPTDRFKSDLHIDKFSKSAMVELLMAVEEDFNILLPDSRSCEDLSVEEFVKIVNDKTNFQQ